MKRNPEWERARRETVDALAGYFARRMDELMAAAPDIAVENPPMLEFSVGETYDLDLVSFQSKPRLISATLMDKPFAVTQGEWYYAQFQAGDYLCFDEVGKPFGMTPERFHEEYELACAVRPGPAEAVYRATFCEGGVVLLEPVDD